MPLVQSIYNGNYVVWQRKVAEVIVDLKADAVNLQKFGLVIAESMFFNTTATQGLHVSIDVATQASPSIWMPVYSEFLASGNWQADIDNLAPLANGSWVENKYTFDNGVAVVARYVRYRIAANASQVPLQTVALRKVILATGTDVSLASSASVQVNALGWQTGNVLKDILEDILENRLLTTSLQDELLNSRTSPKGTWDAISESYQAPIPRVFTTLKDRLDDLELDAERYLSARKVIIPAEDNVSATITQSIITTAIQADAPYRKICEYKDNKDVVDILVQATEGVGGYEEPFRTPDGILIVGKVTYGYDSVGYVVGAPAKVTLYRTDSDTVYSLPQTRTLRLVIPVETDLFHMNKYDFSRGHFSTDVIQDIGVLNNIDNIKAELSAAVLSDTVNQSLVIYQQAGMYYADLVFPSNASNAAGWVVTKDGAPALPNVDYSFIDEQKIRLETHDNSLPTQWQIVFFTKTQPDLDAKINELVEAIARLAITMLGLTSNIDAINDALAIDSHFEVLQFDYSGNDGYDYFKPLTYMQVRNSDNALAMLYKNGASIGAKDTVWVFRQEGVVALHRASSPYDRNAEYSIKYFFRKHEQLVDKIQEMTRITDRDLIARNWARTNPVPPEADAIPTKLI